MNTILGELGKSNKFVELIKNIEEKQSPIGISGLSNVGMLEIVASINEYAKKPVAIITYNEIQAKWIIENLQFFTDKAIYFPKKDIVTYDYVAESKDLPYARIEALNKLNSKRNYIFVTTIEAAMQKLPAKELLYKNILKFKVGEVHSLDKIKQDLVNLGYTRCDLIEGRGQFSLRGGILDISINDAIGVRIEFWGDEIDSIRNFNIVSQRSINALEKVEIEPAHEYILEKPIEEICKKVRKTIANDLQEDIIEQDIEQIKAGNYISKIDKYFDCFYDKQQTVIDYLNKNSIITFDEIRKIEQRAQNVIKDNDNLIKNLIEKGKVVPQAISNIQPFSRIEELVEESRKVTLYIEKQDNKVDRQAQNYNFSYRAINYFKSEIETLFTDIRKAQEQGKNIYVVVATKEKAKKLKEILEKENIICKIEEKLDKTIIVKSQEKIITIAIGKLTEGFENYDINQVVIAADELIEGGKKKKTFAHQAYKEGEKVVFADLKIGDYVVHKNYGIGIYIGVNTITADGTTKDYIKLKYQNDDILYVPTNQLDSIRKYNGGDTLNPPINKLGSKDWRETKERVKKNLRAVARELIELYAKRDKAKGHAFSKDTPWQTQFEDQFPYQMTN